MLFFISFPRAQKKYHDFDLFMSTYDDTEGLIKHSQECFQKEDLDGVLKLG